ncbi:MAG: HAD family hydrolase [Eubacteriales bacterium]|nr:HAD family hydrolase [Eubacteriales bacterium]
MKKGIIFDVDGTLWDACPQIADSWNEYVRLFEPELVSDHITGELIRSLCGQTMDKFAAAVFPGTDIDRAIAVTDKCCVYEVEYLKSAGGFVYPDLIDTLKQLRAAGYHLYIVSNCQLGYIETFMDWSHTEEYFEDTECYGHTLKPKGENIRRVCERNQLDQAVYVGDTQGDYRSAVEAGVPFIHASYGFGQVEDVMHISTLKELPARIEMMNKEQ